MDNAAFMRRLKASRELPKTAAPPPEMFVAEFQRLVPLGEPILCIHPSDEVSGTVRAALVAAKEFPGADIRRIRMGVADPLADVRLPAPEIRARHGIPEGAVVFASFAGLAVALLQIPLWQPALTSIKMLGDISIPLMLFSLGVRMTEVSFNNLIM